MECKKNASQNRPDPVRSSPRSSLFLKFKKILEIAKITNFNLHGLRHTFATRGLEAGIEAKVVQELLGHSTITLTYDTYTHVLQDKKREAIDKLDKVFMIL